MNQHFFIKIIQYKKTRNLKILLDSLSLCTQTYSYIINASKHPFQASPHPPTGSLDPNISSGYSVLTYLIPRKALKYVINSVLLCKCLYS